MRCACCDYTYVIDKHSQALASGTPTGALEFSALPQSLGGAMKQLGVKGTNKTYFLNLSPAEPEVADISIRGSLTSDVGSFVDLAPLAFDPNQQLYNANVPPFFMVTVTCSPAPCSSQVWSVSGSYLSLLPVVMCMCACLRVCAYDCIARVAIIHTS